MNIKKSTLKYSLISILILVLSGTIFIYMRHQTSTSHNTQQEVSYQEHLKHRFQIKGFKLARFDDAGKVLSIKAGTFTIKKKKLGFFRLGLIHTAEFENAIIDLYLKRKVPVDDTVDSTNLIKEELPSLEDTLPSFSTKRISSIILAFNISIYKYFSY